MIMFVLTNVVITYGVWLIYSCFHGVILFASDYFNERIIITCNMVSMTDRKASRLDDAFSSNR